ncbi:MAG TPA: hypothetical protein PLX17_12240 [Chitinophagaceae bacterium]|nr:hypothetical protein [Chitinophagaceae bacterium]MBP6478057.1 hypothetical protein [Chitinophagaceae bacterium]MBP7108123.1 hypothetical protein [Chitinophagaceae bacterium]MBP7316063.1 hypothetical protein [Chitinophagaceae bacterium]HQV56284.1 hypothetical protein [Chitinophagaceae bacterium]
MKATAYYILINIKTANGFESIGKFFIGNNSEAADALFYQLQGSSDVDENTMLSMELMETVRELPQNIRIISCSLEQLAFNCRIITKDTFKNINLEDL